jgi:hypothetical protein
MGNASRIETVAWTRQANGHQTAFCVRCGRHLNVMHYETNQDGWYPTFRIPITDKRKFTIQNCILLCLKCFTETRQNSSEEIPMREIPHYGNMPNRKRNWWDR